MLAALDFGQDTSVPGSPINNEVARKLNYDSPLDVGRAKRRAGQRAIDKNGRFRVEAATRRRPYT